MVLSNPHRGAVLGQSVYIRMTPGQVGASVRLFQQPDRTTREESAYSPQSVKARDEMFCIN